MKARLEFNLDDAEDKMSHLRCIKSDSMAIVLFEIIHNLKKTCEHECDLMKNSSAQDGLDIVFEKIYELIEENGIVVEDIIN